MGTSKNGRKMMNDGGYEHLTRYSVLNDMQV
jgi:hypothetical protein